MAWGTRGLRGSSFEELINMTNTRYREKGLAVMQKIPTPITPVEIDNETRTISLAFFNEKSTVDYIGAAQGVPVCFDAKETSRAYLPLQNIHAHQIEFMREFQRQRGVAFLLVNFKRTAEIFCLPFDILSEYHAGAGSGGRKSIPYEAFDKALRVESKHGYSVHYLEAVELLLRRENL